MQNVTGIQDRYLDTTKLDSRCEKQTGRRPDKKHDKMHSTYSKWASGSFKIIISAAFQALEEWEEPSSHQGSPDFITSESKSFDAGKVRGVAVKWEECAKCLKVNARLNISIVGRNHKNVDVHDADFLLFLLFEGWKAFLKSVSFESLCLNWKEKIKCHAALSHVTSPKDKTLSFPFCRKNESHFHQQQTPTENTGRGDKIGFLSGGKFYCLLFSE